MRYEITDNELRKMDADKDYVAAKFGSEIHKAFRKVMNFVRAANTQIDLGAMKGLQFEKLKGDRKDQYSMRLNDQFRMIATFKSDKNGQIIVIIEIVDYH
jgi:proteic killer suppression protein